jgi:hypothetical protein
MTFRFLNLTASTPQGTWESAMNAACSAGRSAANEAWNLSRSSSWGPTFQSPGIWTGLGRGRAERDLVEGAGDFQHPLTW